MTVTINFVTAKCKIITGVKSVNFTQNPQGVAIIEIIKADGARSEFYVSTISSLQYDIKKPRCMYSQVILL